MDSSSGSVLLAAFAGVVALSLVAAPVTMADWSEQASVSVEPIEASEVRDGTPVVGYGDLSPHARSVVGAAIASPDGHVTVYGREDWPDRFFYSDYTAPGRGMYAVVHEGQHYRLTTYAAGGFPFVYWFLELPFVAYGLALAGVSYRTYRGTVAPLTTASVALLGVGFHLLGPELDFPLLAPVQFAALGVAATAAVVTGFGWRAVRARRGAPAG